MLPHPRREPIFKTVSEQEFLSREQTPIPFIGIYELDLFVDDNQLDCEGIIVAFEDRQYLIQSRAIGEKDFGFYYYEFAEKYECSKILSSSQEPLCFICKENKEGFHPVLRFQIGARPILVTAIKDGVLTIGVSHWDINGDWLEFENNHLLNDC